MTQTPPQRILLPATVRNLRVVEKSALRGVTVTESVVPPPPPAGPSNEELARRQQESAAQTLALLQELDAKFNEIEVRRQASLDELRQAAVEIAMAAASRVVFEKMEAGDYALQERIAEVVSQLEPSAAATVRLNPDDLAMLQSVSATEGSLSMTLQYTADPSLPRGDCRVDSEEKSVLSAVELQLAELRAHLLDSLEHAQTERRKPAPGDRDLRRYPDRRETA